MTGNSPPPDYEEIDTEDETTDDPDDETGLITPSEHRQIPTLTRRLSTWLKKSQLRRKKAKNSTTARTLVGEFDRIAKDFPKTPLQGFAAKKEDNTVTQCQLRIEEFRQEAEYHLKKYRLLLNNLHLETRKLQALRQRSTSGRRSASAKPPTPPPRSQKPKTQWTQRSQSLHKPMHQPQPLIQNSFRTGYYHPNVIQQRMMQPCPQHWSHPHQRQYPLQQKVNNWSRQPLPQKMPAQRQHFQPQRNSNPQGWNNSKPSARTLLVEVPPDNNLSGLMHLASSQSRPTPKQRYNIAKNRAPLSLSAAISFLNSNLPQKKKKTCCQRTESFAFNKF